MATTGTIHVQSAKIYRCRHYNSTIPKIQRYIFKILPETWEAFSLKNIMSARNNMIKVYVASMVNKKLWDLILTTFLSSGPNLLCL